MDRGRFHRRCAGEGCHRRARSRVHRHDPHRYRRRPARRHHLLGRRRRGHQRVQPLLAARRVRRRDTAPLHLRPDHREPRPQLVLTLIGVLDRLEVGRRRFVSIGPSAGTRLPVQPGEVTEVLNRPLSQELLNRDLTRLAYVAKDGTPRTIPIGFTWNGAEIVMCTSKNAPKLAALRNNPAVSLTIDTEVHPPKILLIRGRAELDVVEGIPEEYLQINGGYGSPPR